MKIDREQIKHIAALAKLKIQEDQLEKWSEQMAGIIAFADRLNELNLQDVDQTQTPLLFNVFREDEDKPSFPREEILANAPVKRKGCYAVPKIVE